jgi:hypothetical protein
MLAGAVIAARDLPARRLPTTSSPERRAPLDLCRRAHARSRARPGALRPHSRSRAHGLRKLRAPRCSARAARPRSSESVQGVHEFCPRTTPRPNVARRKHRSPRPPQRQQSRPRGRRGIAGRRAAVAHTPRANTAVPLPECSRNPRSRTRPANVPALTCGRKTTRAGRRQQSRRRELASAQRRGQRGASRRHCARQVQRPVSQLRRRIPASREALVGGDAASSEFARSPADARSAARANRRKEDLRTTRRAVAGQQPIPTRTCGTSKRRPSRCGKPRGRYSGPRGPPAREAHSQAARCATATSLAPQEARRSHDQNGNEAADINSWVSAAPNPGEDLAAQRQAS